MTTTPVARSLAALVLLLFVAGASMSACGSGSGAAADVPSLKGSTGKTGSVTTTTVDPEKAAQAFVACLRKQGLEVADPKVGSDGNIDLRSIFQSLGSQNDADQVRAAQEACRGELANAGFGPSSAERKERQAALLAFTSCLRKQGLTVGDVTFDGPGGRGGGGFGRAEGENGNGANAGGTGSAGGATGSSTTIAGGGPGFVPGGGPAREGGPATEAERNQRLAERLGLDPNDTKVTAAFKACSSELEAATARPGRSTTTTTGD